MSHDTLRGALWCGVPRCLNNSKTTSADVSFHRFPKDPKWLAEWIQRTKRHDLQQKKPLHLYNNIKICSQHFEESMFKNFSSAKKRLKPDAIPTLCLNIPHQSSYVQSVQESSNVGASTETRMSPPNILRRQCNKRKFTVDSSSSKKPIDPSCKTPRIQESSNVNRKENLFEMLKFFSNLKLKNAKGKDVTGQMNFIKGFQQTIRAVLDLYSYLKKNGHSYLFTRRLTSDPIENFFAMLRSLFGFCRSLTPIQVQRGFKKLFCMNYFVKSINSNCDNDFHETLSILNKTDFDTLQSTTTKSQRTEEIPDEESDEEAVDDPDDRSPLKGIDADPETQTFTIGNREYVNLKLPFQNALSYVAGYVIMKCLEVHSCETCEKYATECEKLTKNNYFTHYKAYNNDSNYYGKLKTPAEGYLRFIKYMEESILENFPTYATSKPAARLIKLICRHKYKHPCKDFPYAFLVHFYVRFRIFHILKDNNKAFKEKATVELDNSSEVPRQLPKKRTRKRNPKLLILKHL